ncbi:MAG TPA: cyclodeaminase/cyclohydrolase family protein, partial [Bacteroidales bacterium]|nr:cyclodeaminase/cyclohydrolase family protein [Bacteroidales bacterium]
KTARAEAIQDASKYAMEIPLRVMRASYASFELIEAMAANGNPNSVSDAGVGALCARSAVMGAFLNVKINASGVSDTAFVDQILLEANEIKRNALKHEEHILEIVNNIIEGM